MNFFHYESKFKIKKTFYFFVRGGGGGGGGELDYVNLFYTKNPNLKKKFTRGVGGVGVVGGG